MSAPPPPLTPAEVTWALDALLAQLDARYPACDLPRRLRAAPDEAAAVLVCLELVRGGGWHWPRAADRPAGSLVWGSFAWPDQILVTIGPRRSALSWRDLVRHARRDARQLALW